MRTLLMLAGVMAAMLVLLGVISIYDSYVNTPVPVASVSNTDADTDQSMKSLCKLYRTWQALPEIAHQTTDMDAVCKKIGE